MDEIAKEYDVIVLGTGEFGSVAAPPSVGVWAKLLSNGREQPQA